MNILALDTSAKTTSVSLCDDTRVIAEFSLNTMKTHSQTLMPMIEAALHTSGTSLSEIDLFAVSSGPGSFTGLRIGIGAVKGLALGLSKPCIGVSTLEALAYNMIDHDGIVLTAMDARCKQVYCAFFRVSQKTVTRLTPDTACAIESLAGTLSTFDGAPVTVVGDGAQLCVSLLQKDVPSLQLASEPNRTQRASSVARCALKYYPDGCTDAASLMPVYLRLPQAQRELLRKQSTKGESV